MNLTLFSQMLEGQSKIGMYFFLLKLTSIDIMLYKLN